MVRGLKHKGKPYVGSEPSEAERSNARGSNNVQGVNRARSLT